jgi:hypothetical protein
VPMRQGRTASFAGLYHVQCQLPDPFDHCLGIPDPLAAVRDAQDGSRHGAGSASEPLSRSRWASSESAEVWSPSWS